MKSKIITAFLMLFLVVMANAGSIILNVNGAGFPFSRPQGIAVSSYPGIDEYVYVADTGNNRIQKFKLANPCPAGTTKIDVGVCFIKMWGSKGAQPGQFETPTRVEVDPSGSVYVADVGNNRIQIFTSNGNFITSWGSFGTADGQFKFPTDVSVDSYGSGAIFVADSQITVFKNSF